MIRRQLVQCGCQKTLMGSTMCQHLPNAPNGRPYPAILGTKVKGKQASWTSTRRTEAPASTVARHGAINRVPEPVCLHRLAWPRSHEAAGRTMASHPPARCRIDSARLVGAPANAFSSFLLSVQALERRTRSPTVACEVRIARAVPFGQTEAQSGERQGKQPATTGAARAVGRIVPAPAQTPKFVA